MGITFKSSAGGGCSPLESWLFRVDSSLTPRNKRCGGLTLVSGCGIVVILLLELRRSAEIAVNSSDSREQVALSQSVLRTKGLAP